MWLWENVDHAKFPIWNTSYYAKFDSLNKDLYLVSVLNYPNDSLIFQSKLKVVMALSHLFKFQPEYLKDKWEEAMKEISKQEQTLVKMRDMYREFQVNSFGIYNSDKFYKNPESFEVIAQFDFPYNNQKLKPEKLYYVSAKEKFLISYTLSANTRFMYNGDESARLYTILNENFLAEVEPSQLINLKGRKGELTEARLKFKIKRKINSATDLKREIGI
jgi:hypothetical protein